ncbi:hypothetical protein [Cedratvirus kamchatka]|uniref:Uncharacterized protein n=1 Tax=Cedratvirus kamchatka TaxID=2716914 RepID=A0A6G8MYL0_9VIRU|nr:hypothetical protein [Cedratvirus kamchatka]
MSLLSTLLVGYQSYQKASLVLILPMRTSLLTRTSLVESMFGASGSHENLFTNQN